MVTRLGAFLRARREELNLTQDEVAEACHTKRQAIEAIENGRVKRPSVDMANLLAQVLKLPVRSILAAEGYAVERDEEFMRAAVAEDSQILDQIRGILRDVPRRPTRRAEEET